MLSRKSLLARGLAALVAALLGWRLLGQGETVSPPVLAKASKGSVVQSVLSTGMLEASQLVSVGARVSGQIETLPVALGQTVKAGDLIAQIDSQDQKNTVLQAEAALTEIEAQIAAKQATLDNALSTLARNRKLGGNTYVSAEEVETAEANVNVYRADLQALDAQKSSAQVTVSTARLALERTSITAPIGGTIVAVVVKQGQMVNASQSAPTIVKIADLSTMVVKAEVSEADVMSVSPGQQAEFTTLGNPDRKFAARVARIEPAPTEIADSDTISSDSAIYYNALMEVANPEGQLRIGMTAEITIELARAEDVLTVPSAALHSDSAGSYVLVYDAQSGQTSRRAVEVGLNNKVTAEIRQGLSEGEPVVTGTAVAKATTTTSSTRGGPPPMF